MRLFLPVQGGWITHYQGIEYVHGRITGIQYAVTGLRASTQMNKKKVKKKIAAGCLHSKIAPWITELPTTWVMKKEKYSK